jgi:hypothetical protein
MTTLAFYDPVNDCVQTMRVVTRDISRFLAKMPEGTIVVDENNLPTCEEFKSCWEF